MKFLQNNSVPPGYQEASSAAAAACWVKDDGAGLWGFILDTALGSC